MEIAQGPRKRLLQLIASRKKIAEEGKNCANSPAQTIIYVQPTNPRIKAYDAGQHLLVTSQHQTAPL